MEKGTETFEDVIAFCEDRAEIYTLFASLYDREVNEETAVLLQNLGGIGLTGTSNESERMAESGFSTMAAGVRNFNEDIENELACDFACIFLASGTYDGKAAVPYESIYTSETQILMQDARDEVRAIFRAAGMMPEERGAIPEDYIVFELEYMAFLNGRTAAVLKSGDVAQAAVYVSQQRRFLRDHLSNWVPALLEDVHRVAKNKFYHGLAHATSGFLQCEKSDIAALDKALESASAVA